MFRTIKSLSLTMLALVLVFSAERATRRALAASRFLQANNDANQALNAAFRDGLYLGKLDAENGRELYLRVGRWNSDRDRASFVAGYRQGYVGARRLTAAPPHGPSSSAQSTAH